MINKRNIAEIIAPALYVLNKFERLDEHKLFKILYFADMLHLSKYGRMVTNDQYIAMSYGPVPSRLLDYIKAVAKKNFLPVESDFLEELNQFIKFEPRYYVVGLRPSSTEYLSKSDIKSLDASIEKYSKMSFNELVEASHGPAYKSAYLNGDIDEIEIAKEAGANEDMVEYIRRAK